MTEDVVFPGEPESKTESKAKVETIKGRRYYKTDKGKRCASVTTVLSSFKQSEGLVHWAWNLGMQGIDYRAERDTMADVGKMAHTMIDEYIRTGSTQLPLILDDGGVVGDTGKTKLQLALKAFDGFQSWLDYSRIRLIASEVGFVDDVAAFGGTVDAVGERAGEQVLLDWKSGKDIYPEVLAQTGAYSHLWETGRYLPTEETPELDVERRSIQGLHVIRVGREYGSFHHHFIPYEGLVLGKTAFFTCLQLYRLRKELEKLTK